MILGSGASPGQTVIELLDELLRGYGPIDSFDELPRSLAVVATDLVTGEEVVFTDGDLKNAIRASMAVPGIFDPLYYRGRFLIDGGWSNNLPVDVAIERGAERVIAVSLSLLERTASEMQDIPVVLNQASRILRQTRITENQARAELVITPDLRGFTPADFGRADELIERGRAQRRKKRSTKSSRCASRLDRAAARPGGGRFQNWTVRFEFVVWTYRRRISSRHRRWKNYGAVLKDSLLPCLICSEQSTPGPIWTAFALFPTISFRRGHG